MAEPLVLTLTALLNSAAAAAILQPVLVRLLRIAAGAHVPLPAAVALKARRIIAAISTIKAAILGPVRLMAVGPHGVQPLAQQPAAQQKAGESVTVLIPHQHTAEWIV